MFEHLFQGSPPWLFTILRVGLAAHIGSGGFAIVSGVGALIVRKGGRAHRRFGTVFLFAMLTMATSAALLAMVAVERGRLGQMGNVFGGVFALYLVMTGWLTVRRDKGVVARAEIGGFAGALVIAAAALFWLRPMALGPLGKAQGVPMAAPFILAGAAALLALLDLNVILQGGITGASRSLRHLWPMCLCLFIATGSFFIGQQKDMPALMQGSPILLLLGFAPLIAMLYWLIKTRRRAKKPAPLAAA